MSKQQDRDVYRRSDGKWANKRHDAQKEAYEAGRQNLINQGGGEISIHRADNCQIREKNTISPGNDDYPPKG
ncbi:hypothetical protein H206_03128 [Candidatus Electrothrix aarhusensis]|uniref:DUF2188 domain-containing protein n=1 Tax=Candidatus Electrothrix aarhusensis TaxID=1859131 RepID=A0A3S3RMQ5_9BACT|nr:hypothetical protein H206_03128 [Candidatus Electrothrix aarhusensis]